MLTLWCLFFFKSLISTANQVHGTSWSTLSLPYFWKMLWMDHSRQQLVLSASFFDLPGVDDTLVLLAVSLNRNYFCSFSEGSAGC